jgi:flagellar biogenesis protein FliO
MTRNLILIALTLFAGLHVPAQAVSGEEYGAVRSPVSAPINAANVSGAVPARSHYSVGSNRSSIEATAVAPAVHDYNPAHRANGLTQPASHETPLPLQSSTPRPLPLGPRGSVTGKTLLRTPATGWGAVTNVAASLGLVLGAFLCVAWLSKRYLPKTAGPLPKEVVEQLGWAPLAGRQQIHLVRLGNKLVLLAITPGSSAEALSEVTDAAEVERLSSMCRRHKPDSSTQAFRQVMSELERQPVRGFVEQEARVVARPLSAGGSQSSVATRPQPGRPHHG